MRSLFVTILLITCSSVAFGQELQNKNAVARNGSDFNKSAAIMRFADGTYAPYVVIADSDGPAKKVFCKYALDETTSGFIMNGDYSTTPTKASLIPENGEIWRVERLIISISDSKGMSPEEYGNLGSALTNGIEVKVMNQSGGATRNNLSTSSPVKKNAEWGYLCYDVDIKNFGNKDEFILARWTFTRAGSAVRISTGVDGLVDTKVSVLLSDDFTGLIDHRFQFQGIVEASGM